MAGRSWREGDWVEYVHPRYKTAGHVGKIVAIRSRGKRVLVKPAPSLELRPVLVDVEQCVGWWAKGTNGKSTEKRRSMLDGVA